MTRPFRPVLAVLLATLGAAAATPATAQGPAPYYIAELAEPVAAARIIAGGVVFRCEGTRCAAPKGNARPLRVCNDLRAKTPALLSFVSGGEPLAADRLARCNG